MKCGEINECKYRVCDVFTGDVYCKKVSALINLQRVCEYDTKKEIKEGEK